MASLRMLFTVFMVWAISSVAYAAPKANLLQQDVGYVNAGAYAPFTLTSTTIATAIASMAGAKGSLFLRPGTWVISGNLTIPSSVTLWGPSGAIIQVNTGITLTVQGPVRIDGCDVFTGAGSVVFGSLVEVDPCWFGVKGDAITDDTAALQKAIKAAGVSNIKLRAGTFVVSDTLTFTDTEGGGIFRGSGHGPFSATRIITTSPTATILHVSGQNVSIRDMQISSSVTRTAGAHIRLDKAGGATQSQVIESVQLQNAFIGIHQQRSGGLTIRDNKINISSASGIGILIANTDSGCDQNMGTYSNNFILGPSNTTVTASRGIWLQAGGGLFLTNNVIMFFGEGIYVEPDAACTVQALSEITIAQNFIDGFTKAGITAIATAPRGVITMKILGNNMGPIGGPTNVEGIRLIGNVGGISITGGNQFGGGSGTIAIHIFGDGTTIPYLVHIGGNFFSGNASDTAMYLDAGVSLVSDNLISGFAITHNASSGIIVNDAGSNVTFANLGQSGGVKSRVWCTDCGVVSYTVPTCVGAGPGAWARRLTTAWICG